MHTQGILACVCLSGQVDLTRMLGCINIYIQTTDRNVHVDWSGQAGYNCRGWGGRWRIFRQSFVHVMHTCGQTMLKCISKEKYDQNIACKFSNQPHQSFAYQWLDNVKINKYAKFDQNILKGCSANPRHCFAYQLSFFQKLLDPQMCTIISV